MKRLCLFAFILVLGFVPLGCVSKSNFNDITSELQTCSEERNNYEKEIASLKKSLAKKEKIISLQETAIRLVDDSDHSLQNSIEEQMTEQELEKPAVVLQENKRSPGNSSN